MKKIYTFLIGIALLTINHFNLYSQINYEELAGQELNAIKHAVHFLTIAPDSRAGAMGDVGVATTPDVNSLYWNAAKYPFIESKMGVSLSYTPWLRNLVNDINLLDLSWYMKLDKLQTVSASMRYFALGNITFTDIAGSEIRDYNPYELAISGAYSRKFSDRFSGGVAFKYIRSDLSGGVNNESAHAGNSFATDISVFYQNNDISISKRDAIMAFGLNISNIGSKISYAEDSKKNFIPTNLKLGGSLKVDIDHYNSLSFATDINKLLVPTPPITIDSVTLGKDPDVSVIAGIFQSFGDAPGGFKEELHEITYSFSLEYWYAQQFAVRTGYFYEHETKGGRKYFTTGVGVKLNVFGIDFSYLIANKQNALANTLRFSISFDFDAYQKQKKE